MAWRIGSINLTGSLTVTGYKDRDGVLWFPKCRRHPAIESDPVRDLSLITPCPVCLHAGTIAPLLAVA
jgi:hypothetical protein